MLRRPKYACKKTKCRRRLGASNDDAHTASDLLLAFLFPALLVMTADDADDINNMKNKGVRCF